MMEAHHTYLEVKRSKAKVTRPINQMGGNSRDSEMKVKTYSTK